MEDARRWISSRDAFYREAEGGGGINGAIERLIGWAKVGLVPARAALIIIGSSRYHDKEVPLSLWEKSMFTSLGGFLAGEIAGTQPTFSGAVTVQLFGLEFGEEALGRRLPNQVGPMAATAPPDPTSLPAEKRAAHRPNMRRPILALFRERLDRETIKQARLDEADKLLSRWTAADPPRRETVCKHLGPYYRMSRWQSGTLTNQPEVLSALDAYLASNAQDKVSKGRQ